MNRLTMLIVFGLFIFSCSATTVKNEVSSDPYHQKPNVLQGKLFKIYIDIDDTKQSSLGVYGFFRVFNTLEEVDNYYACLLKDQENGKLVDFEGQSVDDIVDIDTCFLCLHGNCENTIYNEMCTINWKGSGVKYLSGPTQNAGYIPNTSSLKYTVCIDGYPSTCPIFKRCRYSYKSKNAEDFFNECLNTCQCYASGVRRCE